MRNNPTLMAKLARGRKRSRDGRFAKEQRPAASASLGDDSWMNALALHNPYQTIDNADRNPRKERKAKRKADKLLDKMHKEEVMYAVVRADQLQEGDLIRFEPNEDLWTVGWVEPAPEGGEAVVVYCDPDESPDFDEDGKPWSVGMQRSLAIGLYVAQG